MNMVAAHLRLLPNLILPVVLVLAANLACAQEIADLALRAPAVNTSPGPNYSASFRAFQGIPGIERTAKGRLWCTWYGGGPDEGPENYVVLVSSDTQGATWSAERLVIDPVGPIRAFDPCLWTDPTGRLWLFWAQAHTWWDGRAGVWCINTENPNDAAPVWTEPRRICDGIMMNKPTALKSGEWLLPTAVWDVPTTKVTEPAARHDPGADTGTILVVSKDRGKTWSRRGRAQVPERTFDESMCVELRNGDLWLLVRTKYGIGESISGDQGRTWSPGRPSALPHINARFFIRRLHSGRLLLVRHQPPEGEKRRSHLTAFISDDDGMTWQGGLLLDERVGVSYPDGVEGPDGTIYVVYDYDRKGARQILMSTFSEADVLAGKPVSPKSRRRIVINQPDAIQ